MAVSCSSTSQRSYPSAIEQADDLLDPCIPLAERPEQPGLRRRDERQLAGAHARGEGGVDVLEVDVDDPLGVIADERGGIDPADQEMPGVEAPADVGDGERALDVGRGLDERADVRVQHEREAVPGDDLVDLGEMARQKLPAGVAELRCARDHAASTTAAATNTSAPAAASSAAIRSASARAASRRRLVQDERDEGGDEAQAVAVELRAQLVRVEREIARAGPAPWRAARATPSRPARARAAACRPQPGTSQTPHEIGAPASRRPSLAAATALGALLGSAR